jgi:hypothetical protein
MGDKVGRSVVFGLPLQQTWSYGNTGDFAPWYYLQTDAPLYYYSFTDAALAMAYRSLTPEQQARLDPMIIGFNPADMYAADHIKRVLLTFPGVFSGIGEFTIHKEFVSAKIAGGPPSLTDPALDRIFDFAAEAGLVVILHNDINMPFPKPGQEPYMLAQLKGALVFWYRLEALDEGDYERESRLVRAFEAVFSQEHVEDLSYGDIVRRVLTEPLRVLCLNAGVNAELTVQEVINRKGNEGFDVARNKYVDMLQAGILDPTKVTRTALQNAASIAGLMLTTEVLVTEVPKKEEAPAAGGGRGMGGGMDY